MRLRILSDLHLEIWPIVLPPADADIVILAGDIDNGAEASDYPVVGDRGRFVPDLLSIDYRAGKFVGDFTYSMDLYRERHFKLELPN